MSQYRNKQHLQWIASQPCVLKKFGGCQYGVQAHHLLKPMYGQRGMGMKADDRNAIPLCYKHHQELHLMGNETKFFEKYTDIHQFGQKLVEIMWYLSPMNKAFKK